MRVYPDSILAFHLSCLVRYLRAENPACDEVLKAHRLTAAALELPGARIPRELMIAVVMDLSTKLNREDLGFEMGIQTDLLSHALIGRLMQSSQTLGEGLQCIAPYIPLLTPSFSMTCACDPDGAVLMHWRPVRPLPYDAIRVALETVLVSVHRACHQLFPLKLMPMQMMVSWAPPPHAHRYVALAGVEVSFQTDEAHVGAWLRLPASTANMSLPRANARVWSDTHASCALQVQRLEETHAWRDWISLILYAVEDHQPSLDELAALMRISARTLARHLEVEGTSFRLLASTIRHQRACELLDSSVSISEIARILGYSDSANFSRAFKAHAGESPTTWRRSRACMAA